MDKKEILAILEDWNFWSKPFRESFVRKTYESEVAHKASTNEIVFLKGVRRSGKSTILLNHIQNLIEKGVSKENILFVNLEDPRFATSLSLELLEEIKQAYLYYMNPQEKPYIFLDEVQNIDGFEKWLLKEYELGTSHLYATGSNSKLLSKEIGSSLSGRYLDIQVSPLSFREYLLFNHVVIEKPYDLIRYQLEVERHFEQYMLHGGFPKVVLTEDLLLKEAELKSYFDSILLRDIVARYKLDNFRILEQLSIFLLSSISNAVSITKMKNRLGVSHDLASRYMEYLENTYMIQSVPLFDWSLQKQYVNPRKIYSIDTGLSKRVSFEVGKRIGDMLENIVYLELKRRHSEIYYVKTAQGYEVDFLIKEYEKITHLVQVSHTLSDAKTKKRELRALIKASDELQRSNEIQLSLLTMDPSSEEIVDDKKIQIINVLEWLLFYEK
ncbi:ATP-binding protein [Sulfurovum sp.]|uniref:ATP-binding protein n=1 Tax=Sulfurovum sp. TaxID=1969726 RepID=UPI0025E95545|nr:ATP-binding protein [Sulfurovum sp.]